MKTLIINIFAILLLANYVSSNYKMCDTCKVDDTIKVFAADYNLGTCIEFCIYTRQYWFMKLLETQLAYAFNDNPCETVGFNHFEGFEVRSYLGLMTYVDKYTFK